MKRVYEKPQIMFEDFSLSTNIAAGCEVTTNFSRGGCPLKDSVFGNIFLEGMSVCETEIEDGSSMSNGICYHIPTESNNLFNS